MLGAATVIGDEARAPRQSPGRQPAVLPYVDTASTHQIFVGTHVDREAFRGSIAPALKRLPGQALAFLKVPAERSPTPR